MNKSGYLLIELIITVLLWAIVLPTTSHLFLQVVTQTSHMSTTLVGLSEMMALEAQIRQDFRSVQALESLNASSLRAQTPEGQWVTYTLKKKRLGRKLGFSNNSYLNDNIPLKGFSYKNETDLILTLTPETFPTKTITLRPDWINTP